MASLKVDLAFEQKQFCPQVSFWTTAPSRLCPLSLLFIRHIHASVLSIFLAFWSPPLEQGSTTAGVFEGGCRPWTHCVLGLPFHVSLFVVSSLNLWGWWHMWSDCHLEAVSIEHGWLLPLPLSSRRLRLYRLHCLHEWWLQLVWQWSPTLSGLWWLSQQGALWGLAVFLCEKLDLRLHFSCWPFYTVLSHIFWQECLVEMLESVWVLFPLLALDLLEFCQLAYLQCWVLFLPHNYSHISFRLGVQSSHWL